MKLYRIEIKVVINAEESPIEYFLQLFKYFLHNIFFKMLYKIYIINKYTIQLIR